MEMVLPIMAQIKDYEQQESNYSSEQRIQTLSKLLKQAMKANDFEAIDYLIKVKIYHFVSSPYKIELLNMFNDVEGLYVKHGGLPLIQFYCIKGHLFYFTNTIDKATAYYKLAISHATKLKKYNMVTAAMQNLILFEVNNNLTDVTINKTRALAVMMKLTPNYNKRALAIRLLPHLICLIRLRRIREVNSLLAFIDDLQAVQKDTREYFQLLIIKAEALEYEGKLHEALTMCRTALKHCASEYRHFELISPIYERLTSIHKALRKEEHYNEAVQREQHWKQQVLQRQHTFKKYLANTSLNSTVATILPYTQFFKQAEQLLKKQQIATVIMMNIKRKDRLFSVQQFMQQHFTKTMLMTQYKPTKLMYVVEEDAQTTHDLCQQLKQHTQMNTLSFATVDMKQHVYESFQSYVDLAIAHLYFSQYE